MAAGRRPAAVTSSVETGWMSSVETGQMSAVETGQKSAAETGQMSAAETGQMSAVETRQMSSVARPDICFVSTNIVSAHNVQVSEVSIVAMSQCQVADRQSGPKSTKMTRNESRMVARS